MKDDTTHGSEVVASGKRGRRWRRWLWLGAVLVAAAAVWCFTGRDAPDSLRWAIAKADRIVVRDGGFNCCSDVDSEVVLFEVTDPAEVQEVREHLLATGTGSQCGCCGFPGIDWYRGETRVALTAVQHGGALRWTRHDSPIG
jgi:hypothetical protein